MDCAWRSREAWTGSRGTLVASRPAHWMLRAPIQRRDFLDIVCSLGLGSRVWCAAPGYESTLNMHIFA